MKAKIIAVFLIIILVTFVLYMTMLYSVKDLAKEFEDCLNGKAIDQHLKSSKLYEYYNYEGVYESEVNAKVVFTFHNFHKGIVLVKYDCEAFDKNGEHIYGASNVYAKWNIEKRSNRWIVVKVSETP